MVVEGGTKSLKFRTFFLGATTTPLTKIPALAPDEAWLERFDFQTNLTRDAAETNQETLHRVSQLAPEKNWEFLLDQLFDMFYDHVTLLPPSPTHPERLIVESRKILNMTLFLTKLMVFSVKKSKSSMQNQKFYGAYFNYSIFSVFSLIIWNPLQSWNGLLSDAILGRFKFLDFLLLQYIHYH